MVHKPELDRERDSVMHLSAAKADCEGIMTSFTFYPLPLVTIQIQRSSSDHSIAWLEHTTSSWPNDLSKHPFTIFRFSHSCSDPSGQ